MIRYFVTEDPRFNRKFIVIC